MKIVWSSILILFVVLLPGIIATAVFRWKTKGRHAPLDWQSSLFQITPFAGICHILLLFVTFSPLFPDPDLRLIWESLSGDISGDRLDLLAQSITTHYWFILAYLSFSWTLGFLIGKASALIYFGFVEETPWEIALFSGEDGLFTVLDILTKEGHLYRGLYHTRFPEMAVEGNVTHINLVFTSRKGKIASNSQKATHFNQPPSDSGVGISRNDGINVTPSGFTDILSHVSLDELYEIIGPDVWVDFSSTPEYLRLSDEDAEAIEERFVSDFPDSVEEIFENDEGLVRAYLIDRINAEPDLSIPMSEIANINFRNFGLELSSEE